MWPSICGRMQSEMLLLQHPANRDVQLEKRGSIAPLSE